MIKSFRCRDTENLFRDELVSRFRNIERVARRKLEMFETAKEINDLLQPPDNRLEALKGNRKGQYSIRTNERWRVCFKRKDGHPHDVEIVDYHFK